MAGELKLERRNELDDLAKAFAKASGDALRIDVLPRCTAVNLRGSPADESLVTDSQRVLGTELPLEPNRWFGDDRLAAIWLGPDEWLLVARDHEAVAIERELRAARPVDPWLSLADLSDSYLRISLTGPGSRDVLARGCAQDLHPDRFSPGDSAQTTIARSRVLLRALDGPVFEVWVRNSFARYLGNWLLQAGADLRDST